MPAASGEATGHGLLQNNGGCACSPCSIPLFHRAEASRTFYRGVPLQCAPRFYTQGRFLLLSPFRTAGRCLDTKDAVLFPILFLYLSSPNCYIGRTPGFFHQDLYSCPVHCRFGSYFEIQPRFPQSSHISLPLSLPCRADSGYKAASALPEEG